MESGGESEGGDDVVKRGGEQSAAGAAVEDKVYIPGQPLDEGEELVRDSSTYHMYHAVSPLDNKSCKSGKCCCFFVPRSLE